MYEKLDEFEIDHCQEKYAHEELCVFQQVKVFPGRKLDYEPRCCGKRGNEMDFLTAVEFSTEDPYGKAVALLDLRSGFVMVPYCYINQTSITELSIFFLLYLFLMYT